MSSGGNGTGTDLFAYDGSQGHMSSFGYGLGISAGILLLITTITFMSYFCTRVAAGGTGAGTAGARPPTDAVVPEDTDLEAAGGGLDEATLMSYPKMAYSQAKLKGKSTTASCCSICLADYKDTDELRLLPECGHLFHIDCVDPWLRSRPTCPVCRSSPIPSPMPTPLAEVVPLAMARGS